MNRRGFIGSILALASVPAIALDSRLPWEVPGALVEDGRFTINRLLRIAPGVTVRRCHFRVLDSQLSIFFDGPGTSQIRDCRFEYGGP